MDMTERYVTLAEVRDLLTEVAESRKGTAGELEDEDVLLMSQKAALDHAQKTSKLKDLENANRIIEEVSQIEDVTDAIAVKIADILPKYPEDVRAIFYKERVNLTNDKINQILEIVSKNSESD